MEGDASGNGRNGTFVSDKVAVADGRYDGAMSSGTSGNAERVVVSADSGLQAQQFTFVTWIRASSYPGDGRVVSFEPASCGTSAPPVGQAMTSCLRIG